MKAAGVACLFLLAFASTAHGWGAIGHAVTALIAESFVTLIAQSDISDILNGATMDSVASWADDIRRQPGWEWSAQLHYINTPAWACDFDYTRDCGNNMCVAGAILNYTKQCQTVTDPTALADALKFTIHFIGDIHQPLHVGFGSDEGGNTLKGTFEGTSVDLHAIWDTNIIEQHMNNDFNGDKVQYANYLISQINGSWLSNATEWMICPNPDDITCPDVWANESVSLACSNAYVYPNGTHIENGFALDESYYNTNYPIVDMQLAKAGVRMANALNLIFIDAARRRAQGHM